MPPTPLELKFHEEMLDIYEAAKALGYQASIFRQMVLERGGVEASHALMAAPQAPTGSRRRPENSVSCARL